MFKCYNYEEYGPGLRRSCLKQKVVITSNKYESSDHTLEHFQIYKQNSLNVNQQTI